MVILFRLDFWRGGYYNPDRAGVASRFGTGNYWANRPSSVKGGYNLGSFLEGDSTIVYVAGGSLRDNGVYVRCATDKVSVSTFVITLWVDESCGRIRNNSIKIFGVHS